MLQRAADVAIEMPTAYPTAQLDMFYCDPHLALGAAGVIPQTQVSETILGASFNAGRGIDSGTVHADTLATHLALVDESLRRAGRAMITRRTDSGATEVHCGAAAAHLYPATALKPPLCCYVRPLWAGAENIWSGCRRGALCRVRARRAEPDHWPGEYV